MRLLAGRMLLYRLCTLCRDGAKCWLGKHPITSLQSNHAEIFCRRLSYCKFEPRVLGCGDEYDLRGRNDAKRHILS